MLSGPMFEPSESVIWKSLFNKTGAHYNIYSLAGENGMSALMNMFPDAKANELNFCLFSTSGVHGTYQTIEESFESFYGKLDEYGDELCGDITFLIVHPRIVCMRFGNCMPQNESDYEFLKKLRQSSLDAIKRIGY